MAVDLLAKRFGFLGEGDWWGKGDGLGLLTEVGGAEMALDFSPASLSLSESDTSRLDLVVSSSESSLGSGSLTLSEAPSSPVLLFQSL